jgi:hypothetical protein
MNKPITLYDLALFYVLTFCFIISVACIAVYYLREDSYKSDIYMIKKQPTKIVPDNKPVTKQIIYFNI